MATQVEFNQMVVERTEALLPHALKLTQDINEANDLIQETILKALTNRKKFKMGTSLNAWMHTIMRNTFFSAYQKKKRRKTSYDTTENLYYLDTKTADNEGVGNCIQNDIDKSMGEIDEDIRNYFQMFVNGFKYREIAEHYNIPLGTVKNKIHIARKSLQTKLASYAI